MTKPSHSFFYYLLLFIVFYFLVAPLIIYEFNRQNGVVEGFSGVSGSGGGGVVVIAYPNTFNALSSISGGLGYDQPTRSGYRVYRFYSGTGPIQW